MRDHWTHAIWARSHILRSQLESRAAETLALQLAEEVQILQAELHRTQRMLAGYGALVERCESQSLAQTRGNLVFFFVLLLLTAVLLASWIRTTWRRLSTQRPSAQLSCTGGSSESEPELTLDIVKRPALGPTRLHYPNDQDGFYFHHRLLLCRLSLGRWIAATPDHELVSLDLNQHRHRILERRAPFRVRL